MLTEVPVFIVISVSFPGLPPSPLGFIYGYDDGSMIKSMRAFSSFQTGEPSPYTGKIGKRVRSRPMPFISGKKIRGPVATTFCGFPHGSKTHDSPDKKAVTQRCESENY